MKHIKPFILITLFIFWLVIGYLIADRLIPIVFSKTGASIPPTAVTAFPTPNSQLNQGNVLIVFTDDLTSPKPNLISTWALFASLTDHPSLILKALYLPSDISHLVISPADANSMTSQGQLSPEFIDAIKSTGFEWDYFIVMDIIAIQAVAGWISGSPIDMSFALSSPQEPKGSILDQQISILQNVCTHLSIPERDRGPKPEWQQLIPLHMYTDLYFKDTAVHWDRFTYSEPAPHCEVITSP